jgi:hypothetical protein
VCQNGQSRGEPAANPGEAGETVPPSGDATVPANVLKDEHGAVLDTLPTVAKKINALFDKAAKADEKAETYRISAGQELANARVRVDTGEAGEITWTAWCADNIKRSEGDIRKVLAIANAADPAKAAAAERQRSREAVARHRHRAYVSAVSGQCAVGAKKGGAVVAGPMPVKIETVKRDIQLLSADERSVLLDWLIEIVSADERGAEAERSPAMASAADTMASEETAEPPLVGDGPAASIAPPPQSTVPSPEPTPEAAKPPETMADPGEEALEPASARGNDQPTPKANPAIEVAAAPADLPSVIPHEAAGLEVAIPGKTPAETLEGLL